jgi:hypothetical protein
MLRALLYLRLTSLKNLLLTRLRRLRQPKYLAGALVGGAYFYFFFFRHAHTATQKNPGAFFTLPADSAPLFLGVGALALLAVLLGMWIFPSGKPGLTFSEAEIAFLFPAPISRRGLVHYRVLSSQFSTLFQSLLYSLLFHGRALLSAQALQIIVSWWAVLSLVSLHYHGSSLTIGRLADGGVPERRRRALGLALVAALATASCWSLWRGFSQLPLSDQIADWLPHLLDSGILPWVLAPFKLVVQPFFAASLGGFLLALVPVFALLGAHYLWVVRINVAFEEPSIAKAERGAARVADLRRTGMLRVGTARRGGRRPPFDLARARWPEFAFLWKNLLSTARPWFTPRVWLGCAAAIVLISIGTRQWLGHEYWKAGGVLTTLGTMLGGLALLYGPLLTRLDLRQDLANADLLKTYPLPGWRVLLGELLAPIAILTGIVWLGLLAWYLGLRGHQPPQLSVVWLSSDMRVVFALCSAFAAPVVVAIELLIPNAVPLLFPSWFQAVRTPGGGIDLMGQRLIFGFGQVLVVLLALLPAIGTAALLVFILHWALGVAAAIAVIVATLAVVVVLLGEFWCGLWWLGERFEKFDLSAEPRA